MRRQDPPLKPAERRSVAVDLLARRLVELALRGRLLFLDDDEPAPRPNPTPTGTEDAGGPR